MHDKPKPDCNEEIIRKHIAIKKSLRKRLQRIRRMETDCEEGDIRKHLQ